MKTRPAVLLLLLICAACASQDASALLNRLKGTWTWTGSSGGVAGEIVEPEAVNPARTIEFTADREVVFRSGGVETRRTAFEVIKVKSVYSGKEELAVRLSDDEMTWIVRLDEGDRLLTLSENVQDGYSHSCRRD